VWSTVDRYYVYADFNGVDWDAVKDEFEPLVEAASDDETFWLLLQSMIDRLDDRHSVYLTPEEVIEEDKSASGDLDYVGIGILVAVPDDADYAVILFPLPGSPAEAAGIRQHDRILAVEGKVVCCNPDGSDNLELIRGPSGTEVELVVQQPGEPEREVAVWRERIQSQLPVISRRVEYEGQTIGYLLIPTLWDETIAERSRDALQALVDDGTLDGLVLDMRVNGGGAYTELYDLLSLFASGEVGQFLRGRRAVDPLVVEADPIGNSQTIPLVILIGRDTESFAEIFSGALRDVGRATLVGQPTAGNVEIIYPYDLEDGSRLWLAEDTFESVSGERWEGGGVQPDIVVPGNWEDLTEADDPQLDAALDEVLKLINVR
jgi:C-terminal peptidase prc